MPPAATHLPSGLIATLLTRCVESLKDGAISWPLVVSQTLTVLSTLPETNRLPSRLIAMLRTSSVWPFRTEMGRPLVESQSLMPRSNPAEASHRPSGLKPTALRVLSWLTMVDSPPDDTSHSLTVRSWLAEASRFPSGLTATLATQWAWHLRINCSSPVVEFQIRTV